VCKLLDKPVKQKSTGGFPHSSDTLGLGFWLLAVILSLVHSPPSSTLWCSGFKQRLVIAILYNTALRKHPEATGWTRNADNIQGRQEGLTVGYTREAILDEDMQSARIPRKKRHTQNKPNTAIIRHTILVRSG
jgi:hypothetical protein